MNLTDEELDSIVISELKNYYNVLHGVLDEREWHPTKKSMNEDRVIMTAISDVLTHYLTEKEHKKWLQATQQEIQK